MLCGLCATPWLKTKLLTVVQLKCGLPGARIPPQTFKSPRVYHHHRIAPTHHTTVVTALLPCFLASIPCRSRNLDLTTSRTGQPRSADGPAPHHRVAWTFRGTCGRRVDGKTKRPIQSCASSSTTLIGLHTTLVSPSPPPPPCRLLPFFSSSSFPFVLPFIRLPFTPRLDRKPRSVSLHRTSTNDKRTQISGVRYPAELSERERKKNRKKKERKKTLTC